MLALFGIIMCCLITRKSFFEYVHLRHDFPQCSGWKILLSLNVATSHFVVHCLLRRKEKKGCREGEHHSAWIWDLSGMPCERMHDQKNHRGKLCPGSRLARTQKNTSLGDRDSDSGGESLQPCPTKMQLKPGRNKCDPHPKIASTKVLGLV